MGALVAKAVFPIPKSSYTEEDFSGVDRIFQIKTQNLKKGNQVCGLPTLFIPYLDEEDHTSPYLLIYFHANAEDLGLAYDSILFDIRTNLHVSVLSVEYPGYGLYKQGKPSESQIYNDARRVYQFAVQELNYPEENIILLGRSLGGGPATYLASHYKPRALIYFMCFSTLRLVAENITTKLLSKLVPNDFQNIKNIEKIKCPILQIHGKKDKLVPFSQALSILKEIEKLEKQQGVFHQQHFSEEMTHSVYDMEKNLLEPIRQFLEKNDIDIFSENSRVNFLQLKLFRVLYKDLADDYDENFGESNVEVTNTKEQQYQKFEQFSNNQSIFKDGYIFKDNENNVYSKENQEKIVKQKQQYQEQQDQYLYENGDNNIPVKNLEDSDSDNENYFSKKVSGNNNKYKPSLNKQSQVRTFVANTEDIENMNLLLEDPSNIAKQKEQQKMVGGGQKIKIQPQNNNNNSENNPSTSNKNSFDQNNNNSNSNDINPSQIRQKNNNNSELHLKEQIRTKSYHASSEDIQNMLYNFEHVNLTKKEILKEEKNIKRKLSSQNNQNNQNNNNNLLENIQEEDLKEEEYHFNLYLNEEEEDSYENNNSQNQQNSNNNSNLSKQNIQQQQKQKSFNNNKQQASASSLKKKNKNSKAYSSVTYMEENFLQAQEQLENKQEKNYKPSDIFKGVKSANVNF